MTASSLPNVPLRAQQSVKKTMSRLRVSLKQSHFKWSTQREHIVAVFLSHDHVSVRGLYSLLNKKGHRASVGTIYQTLRVLCKVGFARARYFGDSTLYDNISATGEHDHLICTGCGRVVEFDEPGIRKHEDHIAAANDFFLTARKLELYRLCSVCGNGGTAKFS